MADPTVQLTLPWPPSVNQYWRSVPMGRGRGVRVLISREGRAFRRDAVARLARFRRQGPLCGRLDVRVELCAPTRRALDIDNRLKALLDAMQHAGVYRDDGLIDRLLVERGPVTRGGLVRVEITEMNP
ncbi:MAG: RusA family crossover junction endodeoxyribonuclease [Planctomycetota bacterium]